MDKVTPAKLSWREDELGNVVPVSEIFGDVYYSLVDGLNESRYVFLTQNKLPERFEALFSRANSSAASNFSIAELGFGTGLNILATWQLWEHSKQQFHTYFNSKTNLQTSSQDHLKGSRSLTPRLHIISTEKHPLTHADLNRSLESWKHKDTSLVPFVDQLLALYPTLISGCHRLQLAEDVTLDLWLGDACFSLQQLANSYDTLPYGAHIDAWYLDGFAPACNESLWADQIFEQVKRLSKPGTTAATFSSAGVVKRGLMAAGFEIKKTKGFGRKREMLTATKLEPVAVSDDTSDNQGAAEYDAKSTLALRSKEQVTLDTHAVTPNEQIAVIGAGVCGLMAAWSLAQRGNAVSLIDKEAPLEGASGNPRALLAPKMTPLAHVAEHLHSISYLYSQRFYRQIDQGEHKIFTPTTTLDLLQKSNVDVHQIAEYPEQMATTLSLDSARDISGLQQQDLTANLYLPQSGLINPKALADKVLTHPNISFKQANIKRITPLQAKAFDDVAEVSEVIEVTADITAQPAKRAKVMLHCESGEVLSVNRVVIAAAFESQSLDARIFEFRKIRGQLSWFEPTTEQLQALPTLPLKYSGYCAPFIPQPGDEAVNSVTPSVPTFLLGASFIRNDLDDEVRLSEHAINHQKLLTALPELSAVLPLPDTEADLYQQWQARVGIRSQTPDYHPLVGAVDEQGLIWTLSGMGSKGYAFAPLCAQVLADMMTAQFVPLPAALLAKLSVHRSSLKKPLS